LATTGRKGTVSLDRALSKLGFASRSQARGLITGGRVAIDGRIVRDPSAPVVPERIAVEIDGQTRQPPRERIVVMLHKPRGVMTTRSDPQGRTTVYDLIADLPARVIPVGRLDYATSGLLLLTNDTRFSDWLTDPNNAVPRVYLVTVRGNVEHVDDARVVVRKTSARENHLVVTLTTGKNREVRNLMSELGLSVTRLRRVQVGGLRIGTLAPGNWRMVTDDELAGAFRYGNKRVL
jgi:23S rRNA pseudouridine2605 synthase